MFYNQKHKNLFVLFIMLPILLIALENIFFDMIYIRFMLAKNEIAYHSGTKLASHFLLIFYWDH